MSEYICRSFEEEDFTLYSDASEDFTDPNREFLIEIYTATSYDDDHAEQLQNRIITNDKIARHVLSCRECISSGLNKCREFECLKGVYDKPPFELRKPITSLNKGNVK